MPDLYVVTDDFLADGMLEGFETVGIDIPKDVGFVSYSNGGFGPFYRRNVSVIESDAYENADEIARRVADWLLKGKNFPVSCLKYRFRLGTTFVQHKSV